jgi:hypothetical protein
VVRPGSLRAALIAAAVAVAPLPARAQPAPPEPAGAVDPKLEYEQGIAERDAGNFVTAAEHFDVAYRELPASDRDVRAAVMFELVDARRNAFAEGEGPPQICEAERVLAGYLDEVKAVFGARGDKRPDTRKAKKVLAEVRKQITALKKETPGLDCASEVIEAPPPAEPAQGPAPSPEQPKQPVPEVSKPEPRARTFVIAGAATTGVGGLFLVLMGVGLGLGNRAELDGARLTADAVLAGMPLSEDDPELQRVVKRGRVGNGLAIAGGILATAAIAAGVTLIVLGTRKRPAKAAAFAPAVAPGFVGGSLAVRF